jgi:hypothetical protein
MKTQDTTLDDLTRPGAAHDFFTRRSMPPFEPDAHGFSVANALWLMELCRLAYRPDVEEGVHLVPPRSSFLRQAGLEQIEFFNKTDAIADTQAMLVRSTRAPEWAALVFRGTEGVKDFVTDLLALKERVTGPDVCVHSGFEHGIEIVWETMGPALAQITVPLFFTGHSLGAALATVAASRHIPRAVYTFGSPLVGNGAFAQSLRNVPIFRVVDDTDAVTFVPPPELGYLHVGAPHKLAEVPAPSFLLRVEKPFFDHAPVNYIDRLI